MEASWEDEWTVVRHRVIYGDTDAMGIVYYGTYMRFLEIGRNEYVRIQGGDYRRIEADGFLLPVTEVRLRYRVPARYDDVIRIKTRASSVRKIMIEFSYELRREDDDVLLTSGFTRHACLDAKTQRPTRLPPEIYKWLPKLEEDADNA